MSAKSFLITTAAVSITMLGSLAIKNRPVENIARSEEKPVVEVNAQSENYMVRLEGNTVNVYTLNDSLEDYLRTIEGVNVYDLPEETVLSLKNGIKIASGKELEQLIEEITS